jgi:hypothetical protein
MLAHLGHNALRDRLSARDVRLGRDCERVDERLRVDAANVVEKANDELLDGLARRLDTGNDLGDDLEPDIDVDGGQTLGNGLVDTMLVAVCEPKREQTERVLQRVSR